jgi:rifampicin phosphotransferase
MKFARFGEVRAVVTSRMPRAVTAARRQSRRLGLRLAILAPASVAGPAMAFAIPSPELVIGSVSSLSQLVALASAVIGGGAAMAGARASRSSGEARRISQWAWRVAAALLAAFAISVGLNAYQFIEHRSERQARLEATLTRPARMPEPKSSTPI